MVTSAAQYTHGRGKCHDGLDFGVGEPIQCDFGLIFFTQSARRANKRTLSALHAFGAVGPEFGTCNAYAAFVADVVHRES